MKFDQPSFLSFDTETSFLIIIFNKLPKFHLILQSREPHSPLMCQDSEKQKSSLDIEP